MMKKINFIINGIEKSVLADPDMKLLWFIRDILGLTGTKYGCGKSLCGACTVHIDGKAKRSCSTTVESVDGKKITTIEGLSSDLSHPLQKAWLEDEVSQCGYCQPGQIMMAADLLHRTPHPSDSDIDKTMSSVLCRCGTYNRIRKAIHSAANGV